MTKSRVLRVKYYNIYPGSKEERTFGIYKKRIWLCNKKKEIEKVKSGWEESSS